MVVFIMTLVVVLSVLYDYYSDKYTAELRDEAMYLSTAIEIGGTEIFDTLPYKLSGYVTLISSDGDVIYNTDENGDGTDIDYLSLEEFALAKENGIGESSRYSIEHGQEQAHCAVRLSNGNIVRVSSSQYTLITLVIDLITPVVMIFTVAIVLSLILAFRISSSIIDPINKIDLDAPDGRDVYDELRPLLDKINEQNREIDKQIEELQTEHNKQNALRREFTANVSHELKTPLTTISAAAELMSAGLVKEVDIPRFADTIYTEAQHLIVLVNDIMELSRLDENAIPEKTAVDLYSVADTTVSRLAKAASQASVTLKLTGASTLVSGVEKVIGEIVYNLCENAIKYNKPGGSVTVSAGEDDGGKFISVADTGIGIPDEEKTRIFERFYRVDKSHSNVVDGTGLGLSIVKHGAMIHNASIELQSEVGVGTTVKVTFPKS